MDAPMDRGAGGDSSRSGNSHRQTLSGNTDLAAATYFDAGSDGRDPTPPHRRIMNAESKITPAHLARTAYLYIRQSTLRQVLENTESTQRQYALKRRAVTLGWPEERIIVIDHDQ